MASLVFHILTRPPFQLLATTSFKLLSLKTLFLFAIMSARWARELAALRADAPYLQFHPDKVTLYPDVSFLPKVMSEFHLNQPLVLPSLFPSLTSHLELMLYTLDVRHSLAFYVSRTKSFWKSTCLFICCLFICYHSPCKSSPASAQTLSWWIVQAVALSYELAGNPPHF